VVDAEETTAEKTTPKGRDSSEKTGSPSVDYVVDGALKSQVLENTYGKSKYKTGQ